MGERASGRQGDGMKIKPQIAQITRIGFSASRTRPEMLREFSFVTFASFVIDLSVQDL